LTHLLKGERRQSALAIVAGADVAGPDGDGLLLSCFFLAVIAFFCVFWDTAIDMASASQLTHPPPPVRIKHLIQIAEMWCGQNGFGPQGWFNSGRLQALFRAASEAIEITDRRAWDVRMAFLRGADGIEYGERLFERFEEMRKMAKWTTT
jgi:hypothetical protein